MSSLTPPLTERNTKRTRYIRDMRQTANGIIRSLHGDDFNRHDRLSAHPDPALRAELRAIRRKVAEIGMRYTSIKARLEKLDLSQSADWTTFSGIPAWNTQFSNFYSLDLSFAAAVSPYSALPAAPLTPAQEAEWAHGTTAHEIHEAFEAEVRGVIGSDIHFLGTTIITLAQDKVDKLTALRRRRDAMLALTDFPADPYDVKLWGHDTRLRSLTLTPKQGSGVTITPVFSADTLEYTMEFRGDQILRADVVTEDSRATAVVTQEANRVVIRVTSELGDTTDYVVMGNTEAKLASLVFGPAPGSNYPFTPAFSADTLAYVTTAPLAGILNVAATTSTRGAKVAWTKDATGVDVVVTAADGKTKRTYRITSSHSG